MTVTVWIAGTGRMGRDLGLALARKGYRVAWISRDLERGAALERRLARDLRREGLEEASAGVHLLGVDALPAPAVIWETIEEDPAAKRAILATLADAAPGALLLSNSSSILPSELHPRCLGAHVFYPVTLTGFAELVVPPGVGRGDVARAMALLKAAGLEVIPQDEARAFSVNRMLIPVQAACCDALLDGVSATAVEEASRAAWPGAGHLSLMDAVGLDVVRAAAGRYVARMGEGEAAEAGPLLAVLDRLLALGKRGRKNGDGFLCGEPLPWPGGPAPEGLARNLERTFSATVGEFLRAREIEPQALDLALRGLFGVEYRRRESDR